MKKLFSIGLISLIMLCGFSSCATLKHTNFKWVNDPRVEVVNEQTVIFNGVVKIEIITNNAAQVTYVYDLKHSKLVKVARGSFNIDLSKGNYLVQSNRKITKTVYDVIIE
jgi:hypothetical protein